MSPINALEQAITRRLDEDVELNKLIPIDLDAVEEKDMRLYTYIPKEAVSPYINITGPTVSPVRVVPETAVRLDVTFHIWHNQEQTGKYGNKVIANCLEALKQALRFKLAPNGYEVMRVLPTQERIFEDVNADVKHAVFSLSYTLKKL